MNIDADLPDYGRSSFSGGKIAYESIKVAIELAMQEKIKAIVTCPISKESFRMAGINYPGHTQMLADMTKTKNYCMLLAKDRLLITHVTTHIPLGSVSKNIKKDRVLNTIRLSSDMFKKIYKRNPCVAVAGLNPHAGENGLFGSEEIQEIIPAILEARHDGINVEGPIASDTIFAKTIGGGYDIVVVMYHDQGHIPFKSLSFEWSNLKHEWTNIEGVNITLGLPIVRTSVIHGTAFGKAGKGIAIQKSLVDAVDYAIKLI